MRDSGQKLIHQLGVRRFVEKVLDEERPEIGSLRISPLFFVHLTKDLCARIEGVREAILEDSGKTVDAPGDVGSVEATRLINRSGMRDYILSLLPNKTRVAERFYAWCEKQVEELVYHRVMSHAEGKVLGKGA